MALKSQFINFGRICLLWCSEINLVEFCIFYWWWRNNFKSKWRFALSKIVIQRNLHFSVYLRIIVIESSGWNLADEILRIVSRNMHYFVSNILEKNQWLQWMKSKFCVFNSIWFIILFCPLLLFIWFWTFLILTG